MYSDISHHAKAQASRRARSRTGRFFLAGIITMFLMLLPSCKGSSPSSLGTQVQLPTLSIANTSLAEGNNRGLTNFNITVTLSTVFFRDVTVNYATTDGTALAASDYTSANATLMIPAGNAKGVITILANADINFEPNEIFTLTLSQPVNATLTTAVIAVTILNDDAVGLNDTAISQWGDLVNNKFASTQPRFPVQDADVGRDANPALNKNTDGKLGFSFTKLDAKGVQLVNQAVGYTVTPWDCVLDQSTGLTWEIKTKGGVGVGTGGLRDTNHAYSWYHSSGVNDGGNPGTANAGVCVDAVNCDTEKYVTAVNTLALCGYTDWRLPTNAELSSIIDYSIAKPGPTIDVAYFPNIQAQEYWSSTPDAANTTFAWSVSFIEGLDVNFVKSRRLPIRLVRRAPVL